MDDAAFVSRGDAGAQLPGDRDRPILGKASDAAEQRRQILAVHVLHRQEAPAFEFAEVVEADDVLVRDLARGAQLVVKLGELRRVGGDTIGEEFQRDRLIQCEIVGAVHFAHPAAPEQRDESIPPADDGAGRESARARRARTRHERRHRPRRADAGGVARHRRIVVRGVSSPPGLVAHASPIFTQYLQQRELTGFEYSGQQRLIGFAAYVIG